MNSTQIQLADSSSAWGALRGSISSEVSERCKQSCSMFQHLPVGERVHSRKQNPVLDITGYVEKCPDV